VTWRSAIAGVVAVVALSTPARAQAPEARFHPVDPPCSGCLAAWPSSQEAAPLLVVLHGDGESAGKVYARWRPWTEARHVAIFAPACPANEGCKGSWWRWDGDPAWLRSAIDRLGRAHPLDRDRLWLVGWSGGASYVGWQTQAFEKTFAAIVIHGGGVPPADEACPTAATSVYFLVGDKNPLHDLAVGLRRHYDACGDDVVWRLLRGADHEGEWAALDARAAGAIFDWLETKRRAPARIAVASEEATAVSSATPPATTAAPAAARPGCTVSGMRVPGCRPWFLLVAPLVAGARRRRLAC
jgi:poly(3-hydroxybutyrate) depolymerase